MSLFYRFEYRVGLKPWEQMPTLQISEQAVMLLDRYGGDFFGTPRSQLNPETLEEECSDGASIREMSRQEDAKFGLGGQARQGRQESRPSWVDGCSS